MKSHLTPILLIVAISTALYANTLKNDFVYDDWIIIVNNTQIRDLVNLPKLFQKDYFFISGEGSYRPVVTLTYFIDSYLFGIKPWGYHLTNILLHAMNGILFYSFLTLFFYQTTFIDKQSTSRSIFMNRALPASLVFITHPILTESVNAISYREEMLVFFFFITSLILYLKLTAGTAISKPFSIALYTFSALTYSLALLSKEMAVTFPIVVCVYDRLNNTRGSLLNRYNTGYIFITLVYLYLRFYHFYQPLIGNIPSWGTRDRFITAPWLFLSYWKITIFPCILSADYSISPVTSLFSTSFIIPFIIVTALLTAIFFVRKKEKEMTFGILFFSVTLLPVCNIIAIPNPLAERYLYLPAAGFAIVMVWFYYAVLKAAILKQETRNNLVCISYILFVVMLSIQSAATITRSQLWSNDYTLWSDTVKKIPSGLVHFNLAKASYDKGLIDEAIKHYKSSIALNPNDPKALNNLGLIYANQGFLEEATKLYKDALKLKPDSPMYLTNIANLCYRQGQLDEAIKYYLQSLEIEPDYMTYYQVGLLYIKQERFNEAVQQFQAALNLNPKFIEAHYKLGCLYKKNGLKEKAKEEFGIILKLKQNHLKAQQALQSLNIGQ